MSSRREEVAQRKPFKRVFSGLFRKQKGCGPFEIPGFPDLQCLTSRAPPTYFGSTLFLVCTALLVCKMSDDLPAEQQIWKTCPPQGIFALQKSLRAGCDGGRGSSSQRTQPPRKEISRGNLLCAESGLPSLSYPRLQSVQKYVGTPNRYNRLYRAARGVRGAAPLCFRRSPEETIPKGFLWAISSRRLDTALLCAAKKRGVESPGWQVSASLNWRLPPRTAKTKSTLGRHCQNYRFSPRRASINSGVVPQQPPMRLAPASTSRSICCANSPASME